MTIPDGSNFPEALDTDQNLLIARDGLRVVLAEDYAPGDTSITVVDERDLVIDFPDSGFITLTEQCSDPSVRALSFYYGSRTSTTFDDLEVLPGFEDVAKPKTITNVTQNVMAPYHNHLKDAVIAIQQFAGKKGQTGTRPLEGTMEQRVNFLRNIVLRPHAWFTADKTIGLVPLTVEFRDLSFRLGDDGNSDTIEYLWDFGDNTEVASLTTIEVDDEVPSDAANVIVQDLDGGTISKTYSTPGQYDVKLTVRNDFGEDTVIFPKMINARIASPDEAVIKFTPRSGQNHDEGDPSDGPYDTFPTIRTAANTLIDITIPSGVNPNTGKSYGGEHLDGSNSPIDPIVEYLWSLSDDLDHANSTFTRASFSVGGVYDLVLRVDTESGAYRITTYEDVIDVVERTNLWLWNFSSGDSVANYEFGLVSETFKTSSVYHEVSYDSSFLADHDNSEQLIREFERNNGFSPRGTTSSGDGGTGLLFWASGRGESDAASTETIEFAEFNAFDQTYTSRDPISRPWNWFSLHSLDKLYFFAGNVTSSIPTNTSPTNQVLQKLELDDLTTSTSTFVAGNYKNGADELTQNVASYTSGEPTYGHFSVYRTAWKDSTGYILRNDGVGTYFRIKSFYRTSGVVAEPFQTIRKLPDMAGSPKLEGQLVPLSSGVYFFNNSGSVSVYSDTTSVWATGGPGVNSTAFRGLQDTTVVGFDDPEATLLAASDGDSRAYISYDYSVNAFIRFNETDLTFASVVARPSGTQWQMHIW